MKFLRKKHSANIKTGADSAGHSAAVHRRDERLPTFYFVEICNENDELVAEATVREISKSGAQLRIKSQISLPDRVQLRSQIDDLAKSGTVRWVSGEYVGVEFDQELTKSVKYHDKEERVRIVTSHLIGRSVH